MKKLPMLAVFALTVSIVGCTLPAFAVDNLAVKGETVNEILANDPLSGEVLAISNGGGHGDTLFLEENAINPNFAFLSINYYKNRMGIQVPQDSGWSIRRVLIAYRNYEGGITEAEADANLAKLGVGESEVWKIIQDYDAKGWPFLQADLTPMDGSKKIKLADILTDELYYAVEFGHKTEADGVVQWQDEWWTRGKVDYRNCVHSSVFDPVETFCYRGGDGAYIVRRTDYTNVEMPDEEVVSWDEEWNAIQRQRYEETQKKLTVLSDNLYNVLGILDSADKVLAGLKVTLPKSENMADQGALETGNTQLQDLSRRLREYYLGLKRADNGDELESLKEEKVELMREIETLRQQIISSEEGRRKVEEENKALMQENGILMTEKQTLAAERETLRTEKETLVAEKGEIQSKNKRLEQENQELKQQIETMTAGQKGDRGEVPATSEMNAATKAGLDETSTSQELVATTETRTIVVEKDRGETPMNQDDTLDRKVGDNQQEENKESGTEETSVVVPNLGDLENESKMSLWWVVIAGMGLVAGLFWGVRRLYLNKHK